MKRLLLFFSLLVFSSCMPLFPASNESPVQPTPLTQHDSSKQLLSLSIKTAGKMVDLMAETARTPEERAYGLMFRTSLQNDRGMLFFFETEEPVSFWMKNTLIPLDMIFLDSDKKIIHIEKNAPPCKNNPCPVYPSILPAKYVLEVNGGWSEKNGVMVGDEFKF